ncbi:hypothetical protein EK21DRAFT_62737 [Setomelanomma holmii]|uniref:Uncharacterized protein n=1 Tax=Setomelanomma holmii TaxID=210430 RepID=A0A9P4HC95_9PLEO|nr:hypothetical protein EK21DRAFT_62737 [Setomelanomma holmii]
MPEKHSLEFLTKKLLSTYRNIHPPQHSTFPALTAEISDLQLHPTLEVALHIANSDLPSAHFLVRHMQAPPAVEGMLLHGILHRAEGDFDNARAWMGDVRDTCEGFVPKHKDEGKKLDLETFSKVGMQGETRSLVSFVYGELGGDPLRLVDDVEKLRKNKSGDEEALDKAIRKEMEMVLDWCKRKFGEGKWEDARDAWVRNSEEISEISNKMTSGGEGHRKF